MPMLYFTLHIKGDIFENKDVRYSNIDAIIYNKHVSIKINE